MKLSLRRLSLLWRILLSTSIAITLLFMVTGWVIETYAVRVGEQSLQDEVRTSGEAYQTVWKNRTHTLASVSRLFSLMSDVRAAFATRDQATIRDSAQELWSRISDADTLLLVLSPTGSVIASLGSESPDIALPDTNVHAAINRFPDQVSGFINERGRLFFVVLTPVYVQAGEGQGLLNILLAGFEVNNRLAASLRESMKGSDFVFTSAGGVIASTMDRTDSIAMAGRPPAESFDRVHLNRGEYLVLSIPLKDVEGFQIGRLSIVRSFGDARRALTEIQRNVAIIWLICIVLGLLLTSLLARRIVEPVKLLDRAAAEVARHNYDCRVPVDSEDELGRLARTFNAMCDSIRSAREELIRHERISTIGRLSSSIVHDLRNPLAAIYGGAEMLVDSELSPAQAKRLANSIYRASKRIQELLQDLVNVSRGKTSVFEVCRLSDVAKAATDVVAPAAESQGVRVSVDIPEDIELPAERARLERVFLNLMNNALEAIRAGGAINLRAWVADQSAFVEIDDTGPGISQQVRDRLFQPFVSAGKKNGLGLGLALSRQTLIDHGGDLWIQDKLSPGACFRFRIPLATGFRSEMPQQPEQARAEEEATPKAPLES